jgi:hypothetical protein
MHGDWAKPVWPKTRALQGSPVTPYIFDDRADWVDVSDKIYDWYQIGEQEREACGLKGREFVMTEEIGMSGEQMSKNFIKDMDKAFEMWKPRKRYSIFKA